MQLQGQVHISDDRENWQLLAANQNMNVGDYVKTESDNRLLDQIGQWKCKCVWIKTQEIQLLGRHEMALLQGAVYVDSDHAAKNNALEIKTDTATIQHIGTQYSVRILQDNRINILVRSGQVAFATENLESEIDKGF